MWLSKLCKSEILFISCSVALSYKLYDLKNNHKHKHKSITVDGVVRRLLSSKSERAKKMDSKKTYYKN